MIHRGPPGADDDFQTEVRRLRGLTDDLSITVVGIKDAKDRLKHLESRLRDKGTSQSESLDQIYRQYDQRLGSLARALELQVDQARGALASLQEFVDHWRKEVDERLRAQEARVDNTWNQCEQALVSIHKLEESRQEAENRVRLEFDQERLRVAEVERLGRSSSARLNDLEARIGTEARSFAHRLEELLLRLTRSHEGTARGQEGLRRSLLALWVVVFLCVAFSLWLAYRLG